MTSFVAFFSFFFTFAIPPQIIKNLKRTFFSARLINHHISFHMSCTLLQLKERCDRSLLNLNESEHWSGTPDSCTAGKFYGEWNGEFIWGLFSIELDKKSPTKIGSGYNFSFFFYFLFGRDICLPIEIFHFKKRFRSCFSNKENTTKETFVKKMLWQYKFFTQKVPCCPWWFLW